MEAVVSVPAKRRRWWLWGVFVAGVLVVAAPVAWRCRPLNRTERQLLGTWSVNTRNWPDYYTMTFTADRRYIRQQYVRFLSTPPPTDGRWEARSAVLVVTRTLSDHDLAPRTAVPAWRRLLARAEALLSGERDDDSGRVTMPLEFDSIDTFRTTSSEGLEETWRRVPAGQGE